MQDRSHTLSELARRSRRSKATLLDMLADGRLTGARAEGGRREWRITDDAARAAGLDLHDDATIDDAVRAIVAGELDPWGDALIERLDTLDRRLVSIEDHLRRSTSSSPTAWWQQWIATFHRWVRRSG